MKKGCESSHYDIPWVGKLSWSFLLWFRSYFAVNVYQIKRKLNTSKYKSQINLRWLTYLWINMTIYQQFYKDDDKDYIYSAFSYYITNTFALTTKSEKSHKRLPRTNLLIIHLGYSLFSVFTTRNIENTGCRYQKLTIN